jgi:ataxia telangiectasia mutated family protein
MNLISARQIVPFTPFAGLLEWVEQTVPLGDYLMGSGGTRTGGAHARFRTNDWGFMKCYEEISKAKPAQKVAAYQRVSLA